MEIVGGGEHVNLFARGLQVLEQRAEFQVARFVARVREIAGDEHGIDIVPRLELPHNGTVDLAAQDPLGLEPVEQVLGNIVGIG